MKDADIRDISIIDALPHWCGSTILTVGCGGGRLEWHIACMAQRWRIIATDVTNQLTYDQEEFVPKHVSEYVSFHKADILDKSTFPVEEADVVICSEVLEHLVEWKLALSNLISLATQRVIITVPFENSYGDNRPPPLGHCNFWSTEPRSPFMDVSEFHSLSVPYACSVMRIRTKPRDVQMGQWDLLIMIDKRQRYEG